MLENFDVLFLFLGTQVFHLILLLRGLGPCDVLA